MKTIAEKNYVGWYQPHDNSTDFTNEVMDPRTGELVQLPSMTKQSHIAECDINNIIRDFKVTGQIAHMNNQARQGAYVDLPDQLDFQESLNMVQRAQTSFNTLPAAVRDRFNNDPARFLDFMANPANQDEIIKMGLATDLRPPTTAPATGAAPAPEAPPTPTAGA